MNLIKMFDAYYKKNKDIVESLTLIDKKMIALDKDTLNNEKDNITAFYIYFLKKYINNKNIVDKIYEDYQKNFPAIFLLAMDELRDKETERYTKIYNSLNDYEKENINKIADFIFNMKRDIQVFVPLSIERNHLFSTIFDIPKKIKNKEEQDLYSGYINFCVTEMISCDGFLFILVFDKFKENEDVIYGFKSKNYQIFNFSYEDFGLYKKNPNRKILYGDANINFNE